MITSTQPSSLLFIPPAPYQTPPIVVPDDIAALIAQDAPVSFGISGGKDGAAGAFAVNDELDRRGHRGPRILMHSHLGRVEWVDSLPSCERLAERLGLELVVVQRQAGDLMDRWLTRWDNNVLRYADLECVKLILPWSTAKMRFCTSETKTAVICRDLVKRFPNQVILSVSGIRADESAKRRQAPYVAVQNKLTSVTHNTRGFDWHPIKDWTRHQVFAELQARNFPLHEAYTRYGTTRVSCCFCIMSSISDLAAAATCPDNHPIYREMVDLEITSTFSFQDTKWLGDVAPDLLDERARAALREAKELAAVREAAEARIPSHLLYTKGWPTVMPTLAEARLIGEIRQTVADAVGITVAYTEPDTIIERYAALMAAKPPVAPVAA